MLELQLMAEELVEVMKKFALSETEKRGSGLDFSDVRKNDVNLKLSLIGKVVGEKPIHTLGSKRYANQVWNLPLHWLSNDAGRKIGSIFESIDKVVNKSNEEGTVGETRNRYRGGMSLDKREVFEKLKKDPRERANGRCNIMSGKQKKSN
ncbi:hypothetical protein ACH5RR_003411 [Cinchona calisaya]|uniref:Uncharacterized protein n=1 Tax=Cinchona calisaya TaxID=153742 RepID=A0ABD3AUW8_9GENT